MNYFSSEQLQSIELECQRVFESKLSNEIEKTEVLEKLAMVEYYLGMERKLYIPDHTKLNKNCL